jgi:hypothetical protein
MKWESSVAQQDGRSEAHFDSQHFRANLNPSDRYVESVAGSKRFRLSAGKIWFGNLVICGDWTQTVLNVGCLEAAVMSGLQAAAALQGETPPKELMQDW